MFACLCYKVGNELRVTGQCSQLSLRMSWHSYVRVNIFFSLILYIYSKKSFRRWIMETKKVSCRCIAKKLEKNCSCWQCWVYFLLCIHIFCLKKCSGKWCNTHWHCDKYAHKTVLPIINKGMSLIHWLKKMKKYSSVCIVKKRRKGWCCLSVEHTHLLLGKVVEETDATNIGLW